VTTACHLVPEPTPVEPESRPPAGQAMTPVRDPSPRADEAAPQQAPAAARDGQAPPLDKPETLPTPRSAAAAGLTLDQAINATLLADPKLRAGLEAINQANADLLTSALPPNPTLSADVQLLPLTRPFTVDRQGGPPQTDYLLSYPIDWFLFGKRAAAMASAAAGVRISEAAYADQVRQRVLDTAVAFYDVLEAKGLLDLARQDVENLRRVEEATRRGVQAGGRSAVDLNRVRLDVLKAEQALREAEAALTTARARLRARLGRRDADPAFDVAGDLDAPLTAVPPPVEETLALAEQNRPDILALRLQIDKGSRDVHTERTKAYPLLAPQAGYTRQFQEKAIGFPDANAWSAAVNLTVPLFDRNQGNIAKARSVLAQDALNLESGLVDLRAEIVQAVQEFQTAYRTATAVAGEQLKVAAEVRDAITKAYAVGGRTLLEVLDAQRNYRETYRLYTTSRANYWRALHRLNAAIGKQVLR
jgi:outer membrane protein, heavy metal efflux system